MPTDSECGSRFLSPRPLVVALSLWLGAVGVAAAQPSVDEWRIEPFEWQGEIESSDVVAVRNLHGDVRARRTEGDTVTVYAVLQQHRDDPGQWRLRIDGERGRLEVETLFERSGAGDPSPEWDLRRVDMTVYVPAGRRLEIETAGGLIEAKRLASDVAARSDDGEIVITTSGTVDARSRQGSIRYSFLESTWVGSARLVTRTGDVTLTLPGGSDVDLEIRTQGKVSGEPFGAADGDSSPAGGLHAVLGEGRSAIEIESESGNVTLRGIGS